MIWKALKWLVGLVLGGGFAITVYVMVQNYYGYASPPSLPQGLEPLEHPVPEAPEARRWEKQEGTCQDQSGRKVEFVLAILDQEHRWVKESWVALETGSVEAELPKYLASLSEMSIAKEIVAVGTASEEGSQSNELERADRRADSLLRIIRPMADSRPLYKLSLGQHERTGDGPDTGYQRRVIVIALMDLDTAMEFEDIKRCLYSELTKAGRFSFKIADYWEFVFSEV